MGDKNFKTVRDGDTVLAEDVNQFNDALCGDIVPRDNLGNPSAASGASLGTLNLPWDKVRSNRINATCFNRTYSRVEDLTARTGESITYNFTHAADESKDLIILARTEGGNGSSGSYWYKPSGSGPYDPPVTVNWTRRGGRGMFVIYSYSVPVTVNSITIDLRDGAFTFIEHSADGDKTIFKLTKGGNATAGKGGENGYAGENGTDGTVDGIDLKNIEIDFLNFLIYDGDHKHVPDSPNDLRGTQKYKLYWS